MLNAQNIQADELNARSLRRIDHVHSENFRGTAVRGCVTIPTSITPSAATFNIHATCFIN